MSMEIKTYTNVWNADRRIYRFGDLNLPMPLSFKQIGIFLAAGVLWFPIVIFLPIPLTTWWGFGLLIGPPIGLAVLADKPIFGGKTIIQSIFSEFRFLGQSKFYKDACATDKMKEGRRTSIVAQVWYSSPSFDRFRKGYGTQETAHSTPKTIQDLRSASPQQLFSRKAQ